MNIYGKLAKMKCEFQDKPVKKTGKNKFANFSYFKLEDIMPIINALMDKYGLCGIVSFDNEYATLLFRWQIQTLKIARLSKL